MLGKLIKHEFKGSGRTMVPFILVCLGLSVLAGLSIRGMENLQDYGWFTVLFGIVMFLFSAGLIAVCIMALVVCIERFRKNLLGDEGYLMFTLPVSVDEHIFAKLIVSSVWFVATWLVCMLAFVLMFLCNLDLMDVDWSEISYVMGEVWAKLLDFGLLHIIAYILELLALVFAACCFTCMQFYSAMAIGYSFSNHKLLLSVVFFFAINVALSILQPLLLVFTGNAGLLDFMANSAQNISGPAAVHLVLLGAFLYALVFFAVLYIPTRLLLKRRLNLP